MQSRSDPNIDDNHRTSNVPWRTLFGLESDGGVSDRGVHPTLASSYRLRVVAVGALITASSLANVLIYVLLGGNHVMSQNGFITIVAMTLLALGGIMLTPWNKVLATRWVLRVLYMWSVYSVMLTGVNVYFDGGGSSTLYLAAPILTVFFAVAYSKKVQAALLLFTIATYCAALWARNWNISAGVFFVRIFTLLVIAYVTSVLSDWLVSEMRGRAMSSSTADQRASMLDTVARAARRVSSLDASHVMGGALAGTMELGCYEAEIWLMDGDPPTLTLQRRIAIDLSSPNETYAAELFAKARSAGSVQSLAVGDDRLVACLLHREGEAAGILVARMSEADSQDILIIECIELLATQVSAGLDVARNVAERRGLEERLAHWAFHDSLTDLPNRVLFADRLELALARTARDASKVAVLFLDLDDFKNINDSLGHAAGDELLHSVAHRLHSCLRPNDTLARYGGDEFVVLVESVDSNEAAVGVAKRILESLARPIQIGETELSVKTSIGIALTTSAPGADSDVMRRADMAMYEAKAKGGGGFVLSVTSSDPNDTDRSENKPRELRPRNGKPDGDETQAS